MHEHEYYIAIDIEDNLSDCFKMYNGHENNMKDWEEDFIDIVNKEINDIKIKYKNFIIDIDFNTNSSNISFIRIFDNNLDYKNDKEVNKIEKITDKTYVYLGSAEGKKAFQLATQWLTFKQVKE